MPATTRRLAILAAAALGPVIASRASPVRTERGYTQDWFHEGFLDLPEDRAEAAEAGQNLAVVFEQRGCPYCLKMHTEHLAQPEIAGFIRPRFRMVQLDLHGARPVTDFDGEVLEERALARKWRVSFTPTIVFFPREVDGRRTGREVQATRMSGLLPQPQFLGMFRYVSEGAYADGTPFTAWWRRRGEG